MPSSILLGASYTGIMDEEQLRTAYGLQSAILEAAVDAIIAIDDKGLIRLFNAAAERLFGYPASEVIGRNVSYLMPENMHDITMGIYRTIKIQAMQKLLVSVVTLRD